MDTKKILNIVFIVIILIFITWQIAKSSVINKINTSGDKMWVYVKLKTELPRDTSDYYYYGQIKESLIHKIDIDEEINGLFILHNIRYWDDDDLLNIYENEDRHSFKIFKILDINYLTPLKKDPIMMFEMEELHEDAKKIRNEE